MNYALTVFNKSGELLLNESFVFESDEEAISHGKSMLAENHYLETTHRLVRAGKLLLFYR
ncbi:YhzD family protein [Geomicrobium sp. JCM 19039]|uniref:YhzD family protein n=1 Tax=Geomicrobium sp. JCM 19039 TaxID=1460636 RepID=UPI00045F2ECC|nr:YhzD family protein [Geomicrobium sp. JCM 19039]GAK11271.1 hypothetical protein JCM19039_954 [Geomicrobium sp. JCM 19039]